MILLNKKGRTIYWTVIAIIVISFLLNIDRDYLEYNKKAGEFATIPEYETAMANGEVYQGLVTYGPNLAIHKGTYIMTLSYTSESDENYIDIISYSKNDGNNNIGKIYATQRLLKDLGEISFEVELPEDVRELEFRAYSMEGNLRVHRMQFQSKGMYCRDGILLAAFTLLLALALRVWGIKKADDAEQVMQVQDGKKLLYIAMPILIGIAATLPMMNDFICTGHDSHFHLIRIEGIANGLKDGQFPVRINTVFINGYGYISDIMYPELFLYFPAILRLLGFSLTFSYKIFVLVFNIVGAYAAFYAFKKVSRSENMGLLFAMLYIFSTYRFVNLFIRMAVGEWLSMTFLPLALAGIYQILHGEEEDWWLAVLGITCVYQAHMLNTEMLLLVVTIMVAASVKKLLERKRLTAMIKAAVLTVLVNVWAIIPFLYYARWDLNVFAQRNDLEKYAVYPSQFFQNFNYTGSPVIGKGSVIDEQPLSVGLLVGFLVVLFIVLAFCSKVFQEREKKLGFGMLGLGALTLFFTSTLCPWNDLQKIPLIGRGMEAMEFPWRFMGITTVLLCGVAALAVHGAFAEKKIYYGLGITGFFAVMMFSVYADGWSQEQALLIQDKNLYTIDVNLTYAGEYYHHGIDQDALIGKMEKVVLTDENVTISNFQKNGTKIEFDYAGNTGKETYADLPLYHYAGYEVLFNGEKELEQLGGINNEIRILLPEEEGHISVRYKDVILFQIADVISLLTIAGWIVCFVRKKKGICRIPVKQETNQEAAE